MSRDASGDPQLQGVTGQRWCSAGSKRGSNLISCVKWFFPESLRGTPTHITNHFKTHAKMEREERSYINVKELNVGLCLVPLAIQHALLPRKDVF